MGKIISNTSGKMQANYTKKLGIEKGRQAESPSSFLMPHK